jgi:hypothetical protein
VESIGDPIDWALNGIDPPGVQFGQDVNRLIGLCEDDSIDLTQSDDPARPGGRLAVLRGFADWANIQFAFRFNADFADGARRITPSDVPEITGAQARAIAQQVDYDRDGITNYPDNCPAQANPSQADSDGDGIGDACDSSAPANRPPAASAGDDQTVEATSSAGAIVSLDGSASSDPDGDGLTYTWTGPFGTLTGATIAPLVPLGIHAITLTVDDGRGGIASDTVQVTVQSTTPPSPNVRASGNGAFGTDPTADFYFVAGYKLQSNSTMLHGEVAFTAGNLRFRSAALVSLVVSGATAQLAGNGTINGTGSFSFLLIAKDAAVSGGPAADAFQITLWDASTGLAVYDSGPDRPVEGGKIVIR